MPDATLPGFARLIDGCGCDTRTFLETYMGERALYVAGDRDRWADLLSWDDVNELLNAGMASYPRVRLVRGGADVDPTLYTYESRGRQWPDSWRCQQLMSEGATLIVAQIDGLTSALTSLIRQLEHDLHADVRADVVMTSSLVPGLKMHWDDSECFNLQLDGEKDWQVVQPERPYPLTATGRFLERLDVLKSKAPERPPDWSGTVSPGAMIYVPRGWWHMVSPRTVPSMHLSLSIDLPTMADFMLWFARQTPAHAVARRLLPTWLDPKNRASEITERVEALARECSTEAVEAYLRIVDDTTPRRPNFALPRTARAGGPELSRSTAIALVPAKPLRWTLDNGRLHLECNGQNYRFGANLLSVVRKLETNRALTLEELTNGHEPLLVRAFVFTLLSAGLAAITVEGDKS